MSSSFESIWSLRYQQRNAEAERALAALAAAADPRDAGARREIRLLRASLARADGRLDLSNRELDALGRELEASAARPPFQFLLQKAINVHVAGDFVVSLELFLKASAEAVGVVDPLVCLMNVLTCLENLDLPLAATLAELERRLPPEGADEDPRVQAVRRQLTAFRLRQDFRRGRVAELRARRLAPDLDQSHYHRIWVNRLPYLAPEAPDGATEDSLQALARSPSFHAKAYRFRTVQALGGPGEAPVSDQVDRIYLWTWEWLAQPTEANRQLLAEALVAFDFASALRKMTYEDFQLLRNALGWIALFQRSLAPAIGRYLERFTVRGREPFPILAYEALWLEWLRARSLGRDPAPALARLRTHPLRAIPELAPLERMVRAWGRESERRDSTRGGAASPGTILVDEESHLILRGRTRIVSEPLARVLERLSRARVLEFPELLWVGFGIERYVADQHQPKVHNLLARLKPLLPRSVSIRTKSQRAYWEGPADVVRIRSPLPREHRIFARGSAELSGLSPGARARTFAPPFHPRRVLDRCPGRLVFGREELQGLMGSSKASTVRWLRKWIGHGLIRREGAGRQARYRFELVPGLRITPSA